MPFDQRRVPYALVVLSILGLSLPACSPATDAPTVVLVVRHAEKAADQGDDPGLTEAGVARARSLIQVAATAGVTAIYSSQFKRTMKTAEPLAMHLGLPVTTVPVSGANLQDYPTMLAERVLAEHRGETILVVNHSNTVPALVEALGGAPVSPIAEDEYDHFFMVIVPASGPARMIQAHYGP